MKIHKLTKASERENWAELENIMARETIVKSEYGNLQANLR